MTFAPDNPSVKAYRCAFGRGAPMCAQKDVIYPETFCARLTLATNQVLLRCNSSATIAIPTQSGVSQSPQRTYSV